MKAAFTGLLLAACSMFAAPSFAGTCGDREDALGWYTPDFVKLQSGGYLGFATVGVGYATTDDVFNAALYYGWVPKALAGLDIHSFAYVLSLRGRWCIDRRWEWIVGYAGFGAVFTTGSGFFLESPNIYQDDDYYQPTGRRRFLLVGTELLFAPNAKPAWLSAHGAFAEVVALDKYLSAWWKNDRISFTDTLSLALGYKVRF